MKLTPMRPGSTWRYCQGYSWLSPVTVAQFSKSFARFCNSRADKIIDRRTCFSLKQLMASQAVVRGETRCVFLVALLFLQSPQSGRSREDSFRLWDYANRSAAEIPYGERGRCLLLFLLLFLPASSVVLKCCLWRWFTVTRRRVRD